MKIIKLVLAAILLLSAVPIGGFCNDAHSQDATHQCALICHAPCCKSTLVDKTISINLPSQTDSLCFFESRVHKDPDLSIFERPPTVSA